MFSSTAQYVKSFTTRNRIVHDPSLQTLQIGSASTPGMIKIPGPDADGRPDHSFAPTLSPKPNSFTQPIQSNNLRAPRQPITPESKSSRPPLRGLLLGRSLSKVREEGGAEDLGVDDASTHELGMVQPGEETNLEEEVEGNPGDEEAGALLHDGGEAEDDPVGQPLLVVGGAVGVDGLE